VTDTRSSEREDELRERYDALRRAEQSAGVGVWDIDLATDTVTGTPQFFHIMGLEPTTLPVPMSVLRSLRFAEDRDRVNTGYHEAAEAGVDVHENEYRIRRPDGAVRWVWGRGRIVRGSDGKPVRYTGADIDVTARKEAEQALAESESRLRLAVESGNLGIWDWNLLSNEMTWTERAKAIAGFPAGATVTFEQVRAVTHPEDLPRTSKLAQAALDPAVRAKQAYEYRMIRPDGSVRWVLAHGEASFAEVDGREQAVRYTGTLQDITDRKHSETRIRESSVRLQLAIEAARLAVWEIHTGQETLESNPELNRILGFPTDQPLTIAEINARYPPGEQQRLQKIAEAALQRGERHFQAEYRYLWADKSVRWLLLRAEILFTPEGVPEGALGVLMDITDQKDLEERRQMLTRELQHRVNNTLALVSAIANQTFRTHLGQNAAAAAATAVFSARIAALGQAHTLLTHESWRSAGLDEIVTSALAPYRANAHVEISGPTLRLGARRALSLALALNELATNAVKYGALSVPEGRVDIKWWTDDQGDGAQLLRFQWTESGGPKVTAPRKTNFGTRLIRDMLAADFGGKVTLTYAPTGLTALLEATADLDQDHLETGAAR
jgi:PAS domain S-box-containing protein